MIMKSLVLCQAASTISPIYKRCKCLFTSDNNTVAFHAFNMFIAFSLTVILHPTRLIVTVTWLGSPIGYVSAVYLAHNQHVSYLEKERRFSLGICHTTSLNVWVMVMMAVVWAKDIAHRCAFALALLFDAPETS